MNKLLFDSLRGVKLQKLSAKSFAQKIVQEAEKLALKDMRCSQNRLFKILPVNFRYNWTSGKNLKILVLELTLGCWMQKSFGIILYL